MCNSTPGWPGAAERPADTLTARAACRYAWSREHRRRVAARPRGALVLGAGTVRAARRRGRRRALSHRRRRTRVPVPPTGPGCWLGLDGYYAGEELRVVRGAAVVTSTSPRSGSRARRTTPTPTSPVVWTLRAGGDSSRARCDGSARAAAVRGADPRRGRALAAVRRGCRRLRQPARDPTGAQRLPAARRRARPATCCGGSRPTPRRSCPPCPGPRRSPPASRPPPRPAWPASAPACPPGGHGVVGLAFEVGDGVAINTLGWATQARGRPRDLRERFVARGRAAVPTRSSGAAPAWPARQRRGAGVPAGSGLTRAAVRGGRAPARVRARRPGRGAHRRRPTPFWYALPRRPRPARPRYGPGSGSGGSS